MTIIGRSRALFLAAILGIMGAAVVAPTAATASSGSSDVGPETADGDYVVVESFTLDGKPTAVEAFDANGNAIPVPADFELQGAGAPGELVEWSDAAGSEPVVVPLGSGSGGTPSASGCRTVTVNNEKESVLGFTLYWFHTSTYWCWNRANRTTSNVSTNWWLSSVDPLWSYQSMIIDSRYHFAWIAGYSTSGYYHGRQAHMQSCQAGWCQNSYPYNQLFSHSDGTWQWYTAD